MKRRLKIGAVIGVLASVITILIGLGILPPRARSHAPGDGTSNPAIAESQAAEMPRFKNAAAVRAGDRRGSQADPAPVAHQERLLDDSAPPVTGYWQFNGGKVTIAGKLFEGYGTLGADPNFATFDIRGWDRFACAIGITDDCEPNVTSDVAVEIDGQVIMQQRLRTGQDPVPVDLPLVGHQTLTVRNVRTVYANGVPYATDPIYLAFADPRLTKGEDTAEGATARGTR